MCSGRVHKWALAFVLAGLLAACGGGESRPAGTPQEAAARGEPYKVGYMADVTGPGANTWAPTLEGFRLYAQYVNARGGINGHPIQVVATDNRSDASLAAAQAKRFIESDRVHIILQSSASVTQRPVLEQAEAAGVPFITVEVGCALPVKGTDVSRNGFCIIYYPGILRFQALAIRELSQRLGITPKVVVVSYDAPSSRFEGDTIMRTLGTLGIEAIEHVVVPVRDYDLNAIAGRIIGRGPNWVIGAGTNEHTGGPLLEALRRQGWQGYFLGPPLAIVHQEMERLKDDRFYSAFALATTVDDVPAVRELKEAYQRFGSPFPAERLTWGWFAGMVVTEALARCGWPCDGRALVQILNGLQVDSRGLTGASLTFGPDNHAGGPTTFKVYGWDKAASKITGVLDWRVLE